MNVKVGIARINDHQLYSLYEASNVDDANSAKLSQLVRIFS